MNPRFSSSPEQMVTAVINRRSPDDQADSTAQFRAWELYSIGTSERHRFEARRKAYLCPRSVAFNVHGVRLAVSRQSA
jgi:hypothetical protein